MKLSATVETKGSFWQPEYPDTKWPGVLKIARNGGVTLELSHWESGAVWDSGNPRWKPQRIVGIVTEGGPVTIDGCVVGPTRSEWLYPKWKMSECTVHASVAYVGGDYGAGHEANFRAISCEIDGLDAWLCVSGIEVEFNHDHSGGRIEYHSPDPISFTVADGMRATIGFRVQHPALSAGGNTTATVKQSAAVLLVADEPQKLAYFVREAAKLCNFLSLALDQPVLIESVVTHDDGQRADNQTIPRSVNIYGRFGLDVERKTPIERHAALFLYPDVADELDQIMAHWFESYEMFAPAINLYFAARVREDVFLDTRILWLTQALEAFHRGVSDDTELQDDEFQNRVASILRNCADEADRTWLKSKLEFANELTLRNRMRRLLASFDTWFGDQRERSQFANQVVATRNYLTHHDETTTRDRAIEPDDMIHMLNKLDALLQMHLLHRLGIDRSRIDGMVRDSWRLRSNLGLLS